MQVMPLVDNNTYDNCSEIFFVCETNFKMYAMQCYAVANFNHPSFVVHNT